MKPQMKPLTGKKIVSLAVNLPGPIAVSKLHELGAAVTKVEPPNGDLLNSVTPNYYQKITRGQKVLTLDLKNTVDRKKLDKLLASADLLLTSFRPASLKRLQLDWKTLHKKFRRLSMLQIVGSKAPHENKPGHDLTYQAQVGLVQPPHMPATCYADIAGAQEAVIQAVALLLSKKAELAQVSIEESVKFYAEPLEFKLTGRQQVLGGLLANYNLYETAEGWIAVAALEPHFFTKLQSELKLQHPDYAKLSGVFKTRKADEWEAWAEKLDLPIVKVRTL